MHEGGYLKIRLVTAIVLLLSHGLDLYDSSGLGAKWDQVFRLFMVFGLVAFRWRRWTFSTGIFCRAESFFPE